MITVLKTTNLNKFYRLGGLVKRVRINALDDVNLSVQSNKPVIISLVGESGSGKTTLAKVILRLVKPTSGSATIYDQVVAGEGAIPSRKEFLSTLQPIFQNPFEAFSAYRTVDSYLQRTANRIGHKSGSGVSAALDEALNSVGLKYADVKGKYPNQFSGGELQRVSIARALIPKPKIIIADEPVSMIDASLRMNIINLFLSLKEDFNTSFLYITHDLATAYYVSDYIAVMYRGTIVEFGNARDILGSPQHPYTQLLLDSIAVTNRKWERKTYKASDIEAKEFQFSGCRFRNRCPYAEAICKEERPPALRQEDGREVYCHFADKTRLAKGEAA
ncbi:MAG: ABC transporter ATP-binding protein [Trueperaceae bacterium]|nr:ABC transporter ATP-binding protein [Trueperaceae bacterium]